MTAGGTGARFASARAVKWAWFVAQMSTTVISSAVPSRRDPGVMRISPAATSSFLAALTMPADIRHQGYSPKRSMLLVWENASPDIPDLIASGKTPTYPIDF